jgi:hypothetical protein
MIGIGGNKRQKLPPSDASTTNPQVDELTKLVKSLSAEMEKLKLEGRQDKHEHTIFWKQKQLQKTKQCSSNSSKRSEE